MKNNKYILFVITAFILIVLAGIFLPGVLLRYTSKAELGSVTAVPKEYYLASDSAISKNASNQLSEYEKIKLISGVWDSVQTEVSTEKSSISSLEAATMAREGVHKLYQLDLYPYDLKSSYENWYYWNAKLYQCTETTFHTYTAYYWLITFEKYDKSETQEVILTEQGTLLNVTTNRLQTSLAGNVSGWNQTLEEYLSNNQDLAAYSLLHLTSAKDLPAYENTMLRPPNYLTGYVFVKGNSSILSWTKFNELTTSTIPADTEIYYLYLSSSDTKYQLTFIPWE